MLIPPQIEQVDLFDGCYSWTYFVSAVVLYSLPYT